MICLLLVRQTYLLCLADLHLKTRRSIPVRNSSPSPDSEQVLLRFLGTDHELNCISYLFKDDGDSCGAS